MFSRVPQPWPSPKPSQFGAVAETDIAACWGFARAVGELSGCELSQLYLLDQTHTALTNAECRDGLLQALEPSSLPADSHRRAVAAVRPAPEPRGQSCRPAVAADETGFLPGRGAARWVPACVP